MKFIEKAKELKGKIQAKMDENERKTYENELNKTLELEKKAKRVDELTGLQKRQETALKKIKTYKDNTPMGKFINNASKQAKEVDMQYGGMSFDSGMIHSGKVKNIKEKPMSMSLGSQEPKRKNNSNMSIGVGFPDDKKKKNKQFMF